MGAQLQRKAITLPDVVPQKGQKVFQQLSAERLQGDGSTGCALACRRQQRQRGGGSSGRLVESYAVQSMKILHVSCNAEEAYGARTARNSLTARASLALGRRSVKFVAACVVFLADMGLIQSKRLAKIHGCGTKPESCLGTSEGH